ncbi:hypothetical protein PanWU01x14_009740 [Parasponia andersonii]|uniref:Uncharacterized protein n=1 Tax=Parasponia andersonii TaxID=3476 RepID=A0A2P5E2G9_PARAD|nr:hypothetical protein PanWU01x14_009740 [Parasponia andersonii]
MFPLTANRLGQAARPVLSPQITMVRVESMEYMKDKRYMPADLGPSLNSSDLRINFHIAVSIHTKALFGIRILEGKKL